MPAMVAAASSSIPAPRTRLLSPSASARAAGRANATPSASASHATGPYARRPPSPVGTRRSEIEQRGGGETDGRHRQRQRQSSRVALRVGRGGEQREDARDEVGRSDCRASRG